MRIALMVVRIFLKPSSILSRYRIVDTAGR